MESSVAFRLGYIKQANNCTTQFVIMITSKRFNDFQRIAVAVFVIFACAVNCNPSNKPSESAAEYKVVETENGKVRGMRKTTLIKGVDYYSFKGVPYAKSPIGELRFKVS